MWSITVFWNKTQCQEIELYYTYLFGILNISLVDIRNANDMGTFSSSACHTSAMPDVNFKK